MWANGKPAAFEAVHWRFESFRLCCINKSILRSSNCWSLRLALNQKLAGSIPASGAVAVLYWFRNLAVNQVYIGSIPFDHPHTLEDIRLDEDAVLKTAGANHASGFESLVFRFD